MNTFKELYYGDINRLEWNNKYSKLFSFFHRKAQCSKGIKGKFYRTFFKMIRSSHGLEIGYNVKIGKGFRLMHAYNITINTYAILGDNIDLYKGVTIGEEKRGGRKGAPNIGNCVWIGANSTVVGKINIGDDVLIAPNTFVNCDVPSHSIVIGNPCKIISKENATEGYIVNRV